MEFSIAKESRNYFCGDVAEKIKGFGAMKRKMMTGKKQKPNGMAARHCKRKVWHYKMDSRTVTVELEEFGDGAFKYHAPVPFE